VWKEPQKVGLAHVLLTQAIGRIPQSILVRFTDPNLFAHSALFWLIDRFIPRPHNTNLDRHQRANRL
jgi:hypothetical protein